MGMFFRGTRLGYMRGMGSIKVLLLLISFGCLMFVGTRIVRVVSQIAEQNQSSVGNLFRAEEAKVLRLPMPDTPQRKNFTWKYQGKTYVLETTLYESYYEFYTSLPTGVPLLGDGGQKDAVWWAKLNTLFLSPIPGDTTFTDIAHGIQKLGEQNRLSENQLVELVAAFVQSLPYDQEKTNRRENGLDGESEKTTYPYEVLYTQTGVCQDKSYLAYRLLRELGIGVSIFLFPDPRDNHMAVGVQCPSEYANYGSQYCFLETTSTGNKIGTVPSLVSASRVATAQIEIGDVLHDQSENQYQALGRVEILNAVSGKEYTGIIDTLRTRDEIDRLRKTIYAYKRELAEQGSVIATEEKKLDQYDAQLSQLKRKKRYEEYNDLVEPYNKLVTEFERHISNYNALVEKSNQAIARYNKESKSFYE